MSSSPAAYYNLHLSNKIDDIAATPSESEQEQDPLSSIIDTELVTSANSCNDEDFNDYLNNFVQVQVQETEPRHVSHLRDGLWPAVASPSTSKTDGNDDETTSTSNPTPTDTDTPDYTEKESKTAVTLKFDDNIGIGSDENMYFDFDEDEDEEAMAQYGESENEKLCSSSTNTTTTNTKWDNNWQQKFSELQVRVLCCVP